MAEADALAVTDGDPEMVALPEPEPDRVRGADPDARADTVAEADSAPDTDSEPVGDAVAEADAEDDLDPRADRVPDAEPVREADGVAVPDSVAPLEGVAAAEPVAVRLLDPESVCDRVPLAEADSVLGSKCGGRGGEGGGAWLWRGSV